MRYRLLDPQGDYSFGKNQADFLVDSPAAVAQLILTRLKLWTGEWFLDLTEGTAWTTQVVGYGTASVRDQMIRNRILSTEGVLAIVSYDSRLDTPTRHFHVDAVVSTIFGPLVTVVTDLPLVPFQLDVSALDGRDALGAPGRVF